MLLIPNIWHFSFSIHSGSVPAWTGQTLRGGFAGCRSVSSGHSLVLYDYPVHRCLHPSHSHESLLLLNANFGLAPFRPPPS